MRWARYEYVFSGCLKVGEGVVMKRTDFGEGHQLAAGLASLVDEVDGLLHAGFEIEPLDEHLSVPYSSFITMIRDEITYSRLGGHSRGLVLGDSHCERNLVD